MRPYTLLTIQVRDAQHRNLRMTRPVEQLVLKGLGVEVGLDVVPSKADPRL